MAHDPEIGMNEWFLSYLSKYEGSVLGFFLLADAFTTFWMAPLNNYSGSWINTSPEAHWCTETKYLTHSSAIDEWYALTY